MSLDIYGLACQLPVKMRRPMLEISGDTLRQSVSMVEAIDAVQNAFIKVSAGGIEQPTRLVLERGTAIAMLARDRANGTIALKALTIRPENRAVGLAAIQAVVIVFDGPSGTAQAIIDGTALTALRTGAASGTATNLLAAKDARVLAMIGAGGQSADQIRAVCAVRPITEVCIFSRDEARAKALAARLTPELKKVRLTTVTGIPEAISRADIICTATPSTAPLFDVADLKPNAHVNAIGAFTPAMCELPPELLRDADIIAIDEMEASMTEAGDLLQAIDQGMLNREKLVELGKLLVDPGLSRGRGWTVFKSVGIAAQDLAVAELAVKKVTNSMQA